MKKLIIAINTIIVLHLGCSASVAQAHHGMTSFKLPSEVVT